MHGVQIKANMGGESNMNWTYEICVTNLRRKPQMKEISQKSYALYMKKQCKRKNWKSVKVWSRFNWLSLSWCETFGFHKIGEWMISWPDSPSQERRDGVPYNKQNEEVKISSFSPPPSTLMEQQKPTIAVPLRPLRWHTHHSGSLTAQAISMSYKTKNCAIGHNTIKR
jgi:hypothetical protein